MPLSNLIDEFQPIIAPGFETDFLKASVAYMQNPKDKLGFNSFAYSMRVDPQHLRASCTRCKYQTVQLV